MTKLWGGRFAEEPAPEMLAFTESLSFDRQIAREDCAVLAAHARALVRAELLSESDATAIALELERIAQEIAAGTFEFRPGDEDVHTAIERALLERLPDAAPRARAGLSRNDRVATALRLWLRAQGAAIVEDVAALAEVFLARADEAGDAVLPGYTHLQRAQPVTLAHHLLAHAFALVRDGERMRDALARADVSPLGAGALAGSTLGLDAAASAADLGFARAMANSLDAVSARDFVAEFLAAAAICGVHCSRIGEEIVLWTSEEFGFASLSDAHATGSSLMPQKKNPDVAELSRGKAGRLIGNLTGLLATLKGLPLAYNRDLQEDKEPLFDSVHTLRAMLPALAGAVRGLRFDTARMSDATAGGTLLATDLADMLVRAGVPFRRAHEIVGGLVVRAIESGTDLADLPLEDVEGGVLGADARAALSADVSVRRRSAPGPCAESVAAQIAEVRSSIARLRER